MARLIKKNPGFHPRRWLSQLPKMDAFGALLFQVVGQQLSVDATRGILRKIMSLFNDQMPTPKRLLAVPPGKLHKRGGLSRRKVSTLRLLARRFVDGSLSQKKFEKMTDEQIENELTQIPGIGPWTVHGFLIIALDRPDVVLPGDLALRKVIKRVYRMKDLPTEAKVLQMSERWRPYRSLATGYLFQSAYGAE